MSSYADIQPIQQNPLRKAESWLDQRGRMAWIAAMVLSLIFVWPVGLALLAYMVWQNKFALSTSTGRKRSVSRGSTGNAAFDAYRNETLQRLEEEQAAFEGFLKRLREARDKAEFDQFMEEKRRSSSDA